MKCQRAAVCFLVCEGLEGQLQLFGFRWSVFFFLKVFMGSRASARLLEHLCYRPTGFLISLNLES